MKPKANSKVCPYYFYKFKYYSSGTSLKEKWIRLAAKRNPIDSRQDLQISILVISLTPITKAEEQIIWDKIAERSDFIKDKEYVESNEIEELEPPADKQKVLDLLTDYQTKGRLIKFEKGNVSATATG